VPSRAGTVGVDGNGGALAATKTPKTSGQNSHQNQRLSQSPPSRNLGGSSAVVLQVREGQNGGSSAAVQPRQGLADAEKAEVEHLKARDREVRAHENAHAATGGAYTGAPSYDYARGPDGVQYAVGGHVDIDVSPVPNDPKATIAKLDVVRSAALAPARPSGQDRAVAAAASAGSREAEAELSKAEQDAAAEALQADDGADEAPIGSVTSSQATPYVSSDFAPSGLIANTTTVPQGLTGLDLLV